MEELDIKGALLSQLPVYSAIWDAEIAEQVHVVFQSPVMNTIDYAVAIELVIVDGVVEKYLFIVSL